MSKQINGKQRLGSSSQIHMQRVKEKFDPLNEEDSTAAIHELKFPKPYFPNKRSVDKRQKHRGISTFIDLEI